MHNCIIWNRLTQTSQLLLTFQLLFPISFVSTGTTPKQVKITPKAEFLQNSVIQQQQKSTGRQGRCHLPCAVFWAGPPHPQVSFTPWSRHQLTKAELHSLLPSTPLYFNLHTVQVQAPLRNPGKLDLPILRNPSLKVTVLSRLLL